MTVFCIANGINAICKTALSANGGKSELLEKII